MCDNVATMAMDINSYTIYACDDHFYGSLYDSANMENVTLIECTGAEPGQLCTYDEVINANNT